MITYMPILKSKPAEFWACKHATPAVMNNSRVLFEVVPSADLNDAIDKFIDRASKNWPRSHTVTVDCGYINPPKGSAVLWVAKELHLIKIQERPVFRIDDSIQILNEVAAACALHNEGACLRLGSTNEDPSPSISTAQLTKILKIIGLKTTEVDLLIDFSAVASTRDVTRCVPAALNMLTWANSNGHWRSVTIASGAFPASISNLNLGVITSLQRYDANLFSHIMAAGPSIEPDYGDYVINNPLLQPPAPRGPKPNLRYTSGLMWQVLREDTILPGNKSFCTACTKMVHSVHWSGQQYSAGDAEIERCSREVGGAGTATQWLEWGASHHMAYVIDRLANLGAP